MMQRINPTRMNLIETKRRSRTARRGYDILKKKREVIVLEFLKLLKQSGKDREYLYKLLSEAYKVMAISSSYVGNFELESSALHAKEVKPIGISIKNVMGVKVPEIEKNPNSGGAGYESLISESVAVEDIKTTFSDAVNAILDVAQREQGLKRLVIEIEKTKRRVNALDYVVIPGLNSQSRYISMRLEELERDMFSALKHVKKRLAKVS